VKEYNYTKSFLLVTHIILGGILIFFTVMAMMDYSKNIAMGLSVSLLILSFYLFILIKSVSFFKKAKVGVAYFLSIAGFVILMFSQIVNCSNSIRWMH